MSFEPRPEYRRHPSSDPLIRQSAAGRWAVIPKCQPSWADPVLARKVLPLTMVGGYGTSGRRGYLFSAAGFEAGFAGDGVSVLAAGLDSGLASVLDSEPSELFDVPLRA